MSAWTARVRAKGRSASHDTRAAASDPDGLVARVLADATAERCPPTVPDYELRATLGTGGFGAVHLARHRASGRLVALKVLLPRIAAEAGTRERFRREIDVHARLAHPNVVALHDHGEVAGAFWFTMEYCPGGSLARLLQASGGRLDLARAAPLMLDALAGLGAAHRRGFVHRDIKPHNILLARGPAAGRWTAKISDFGLARHRADAVPRGAAGVDGGSWPYMPPEQFVDQHEARPDGDVWSLAASFYQVLAGTPPRQVAPDVSDGTPVPIGRRVPDLAGPVAQVIDRALDPDPTRRFCDADELRSALLAVLGGSR